MKDLGGIACLCGVSMNVTGGEKISLCGTAHLSKALWMVWRWDGEARWCKVKVIWAEIAWWGSGWPVCPSLFDECGRFKVAGLGWIYRAKASVIAAAGGTPTQSIDNICSDSHVFTHAYSPTRRLVHG